MFGNGLNFFDQLTVAQTIFYNDNTLLYSPINVHKEFTHEFSPIILTQNTEYKHRKIRSPMTGSHKRISLKCIHGREKNRCTLGCGGSIICKHNRQKYLCKECKGASICEHGQVRSRCIPCEGGSICKHLRVRSNCSHCCNLKSKCLHGKIKRQCKECCDPNILCLHGKIKYRCIRECKSR